MDKLIPFHRNKVQPESANFQYALAIETLALCLMQIVLSSKPSSQIILPQ